MTPARYVDLRRLAPDSKPFSVQLVAQVGELVTVNVGGSVVIVMPDEYEVIRIYEHTPRRRRSRRAA